MKPEAGRIRSILALHALLFGEGLLEAEGGLTEELRRLEKALEEPDPRSTRRIASILALYGLLFEPPGTAAELPLLTEVDALLESLRAPPTPRPDGGRLKAFQLERYGRSLRSPEDLPGELPAGSLACVYRTDERSASTIFRILPAGALQLEPVGSSREGGLRFRLSGSILYLLFEAADCPDKHVEFYLREGELAAPFRFEELELFRTSRSDAFYIPRDCPFSLPFSLEARSDGGTGAFYFPSPGAPEALELFLYRFLNSRARLPFTQLRAPLRRFMEFLTRTLP